ncbi:MAG TPA: hypothetical protein VMV94_01430 [Phycisphaerae bacterium]|nr:hypothetical protein [Phycisphaerae bacterium]
MARKKSRKSREQNRQSEGGAFWHVLLKPELRRPILWGLALGLIVGTAAVGVCMAFDRMNSGVHALPKYDRSLTLSWEDLPDWLQLPDNRHILEELTQRVDLRDSDRLLDRHLAERIGKALSDPSAGWVKSVVRVTVQPNSTVSIKCLFRRPAAWVRHGRYCYLVDEESVRLPGRYEAAAAGGSALLTIEGVGISPPEVGQVWRGGDLTSGLKLSAVLANKPFRHQIAAIDVSNHDGRRDRNRPYLELTTDREGSRIWWGRPPDEEFGTEIRANQKITLLETLYRQWGRIDMNRAYVNVMTWPDRITMPAVSPESHPPRRLVRS